MYRLSACLCAAVLAAVPAAWAPAAAGAGTVHRVTASDLGPNGSWNRFQDDPSSDRDHGTEEVSAFSAPDTFDGSLHLAVSSGRQSQAAHYFGSTVALSTIMESPLAYDSYVDGEHSTATDAAAALQLPVFCDGTFTTLSFRPQSATDAEGRRGVVPDVWQHFDSGPAGIWRTSRTLPGAPGLDAGADAPLSDFAAACDSADSGAIGLVAGVPRLEKASATLDAYVDNLTADGAVYDFAVRGRAEGEVSLRGDAGGERTASGAVTFTSPDDGPQFRAVGTRLVFAGQGPLSPDDVTVTADGRAVVLTPGADGTLSADFGPSSAADLVPGGAYSTPVTVTLRDEDAGGAGTAAQDRGRVRVTAELLARGSQPLQPTGVRTSSTVRG